VLSGGKLFYDDPLQHARQTKQDNQPTLPASIIIIRSSDESCAKTRLELISGKV
jgi:hypothetical protein